MAAPKELTLANLAGGALMECVTAEMRRVCENIQDPNSKAEAKRKLQINIVFEPDERRAMTDITYDVKATLVGPDTGKSMAYITRVAGTEEFTLVEVESQPPLFEPEDSQPQVPALRSGTQG